MTLCYVVADPPGMPVITGYENNQSVRVNDTVAMMCTSTGGNPVAQIAWYKVQQLALYKLVL